MRYILYKARRRDNGEWIEGYPVIIKGSEQCYMFTGQLSLSGCLERKALDFVRVEVESATLCQYIGLTDEKGKRIYENDIVAFEDRHSTENGYVECDCEGQVVWDDEELCFAVTERLSAESYEVLGDYCVVIGNFYDNPAQEV